MDIGGISHQQAHQSMPPQNNNEEQIDKKVEEQESFEEKIAQKIEGSEQSSDKPVQEEQQPAESEANNEPADIKKALEESMQLQQQPNPHMAQPHMAQPQMVQPQQPMMQQADAYQMAPTQEQAVEPGMDTVI